MTPKPEPQNSKPGFPKPARKDTRMGSETARLFVNLDEIVRRASVVRMTRYVE